MTKELIRIDLALTPLEGDSHRICFILKTIHRPRTNRADNMMTNQKDIGSSLSIGKPRFILNKAVIMIGMNRIKLMVVRVFITFWRLFARADSYALRRFVMTSL